jgi:eukaryotic-like serine/threonine-protein kinase
VLRREAETAILPRLSDFLENKWQPQDNSERLALLGVCQFEARWKPAAQLYADAFASNPNLGEQLIATGFSRFPWKHATMDPFDVLCSYSRFGAARCAALAGCSPDSRDDETSAAEQVAWQKQAIQWLREDLIVWGTLLENGSALERDVAKQMLTRWTNEPDLSSIRDTAALSEMSADRSAECSELWEKVHEALAARSTASQASTLKSDHNLGE